MLQAVFADGVGWAVNIKAFKLGESQQRVRTKSFSLGITKTTEGIGSETLSLYAIHKFEHYPMLE